MMVLLLANVFVGGVFIAEGGGEEGNDTGGHPPIVPIFFCFGVS